MWEGLVHVLHNWIHLIKILFDYDGSFCIVTNFLVKESRYVYVISHALTDVIT